MSSRQIPVDELGSQDRKQLEATMRELALKRHPDATPDELDDLVEESLATAILCTR